MPGRQLSPHAEQVLKERLRFCEEQQLYEGTAFFREALTPGTNLNSKCGIGSMTCPLIPRVRQS
jgi:hypothetical protein